MQDLIAVRRDIIMRMCPLLAIAPELYSVKLLALLEPRLQPVGPANSPMLYCQALMPWRTGTACHLCRLTMHKISSLAYSAVRTLPCFIYT